VFQGSIQEEEEGYNTMGAGDRISTFRTEMMSKDGGFRQPTMEMPTRQSPVAAFNQAQNNNFPITPSVQA
jgi:hypothetical protein